MKKNKFVELVLQRISNAVVTNNKDVKRPDIECMLPAVIAHVNQMSYWQKKADARASGEDFELSEDLLQSQVREIQNELGRWPFIELPEYQSFGNKSGIDSISPTCGCNFVPIKRKQLSMMKTVKDYAADQIFYIIEAGKALFPYGIPPTVKEVTVVYSGGSGESEGDETLAIPEGFEKTALDILVDWFIGTTNTQKDYINNERSSE